MSTEQRRAYDAGYDCGQQGPNETNCHFSIFNKRENTAAWEQGKEDAEAGRPQRSLL